MNLVIEDGNPVMCGECRQNQFWLKTGKGKAAVTVRACGCALPPAPVKQGRKKCSPKNAKAKGNGFEVDICKFAREAGWEANRTAGSGAHGTRTNETAFIGDVRLKLKDFAIRVEAKRHAVVAGLKSLLNMKGPCEILWVKEDFRDDYALVDGKLMRQLLALAAEALKK